MENISFHGKHFFMNFHLKDFTLLRKTLFYFFRGADASFSSMDIRHVCKLWTSLSRHRKMIRKVLWKMLRKMLRKTLRKILSLRFDKDIFFVSVKPLNKLLKAFLAN